MRIRALQHNITRRFEECIESGLSDNIATRLVNPEIGYAVGGDIQTPQAVCETGKISVSETHLSYLWGVIYSLYVIEDLGVRQPLNGGAFTGEVDFSHPVLFRARTLFEWALSLRDGSSTWPTFLPGPEGSGRQDESDHIGKANGLFIDAVTLLLCHEYAHLVNRHCETIAALRRKPLDALSEGEAATLKQLESEADTFARECLTKFDDSENARVARGFASVLLHCADLLLLSNISILAQHRHPDLDQRLLHAIEFLNIADPQNEEAVWLIAAFACRRFFDLHHWVLSEPPNPSAQDLFEYYLREFDLTKRHMP